MKVLHIISSLGDGGAEAVLYRICTFDKACQHEVISLTGMGKYGGRLIENGIEVVCLNMMRGKLSKLRDFIRLVRIIRRSKPDVVQTWMYHADLLGGLAARLAGVNNVFWGIRNTSLSPEFTSKGTIFVARACAALSAYVPRKIICAAGAAKLAHAEFGYSERRMTVIHNGYDFIAYRPDRDLGWKIRQDLGLGCNDDLIGCVARYDKIKGHSNLLDALSILKSAGITPYCLLVGSGLTHDNVEIRDEIERRGLQRQIILFGPTTDIPGIMNAIDVHVLPSRSEAFPNVLAESMACGTPCITTDVGDAALIVGELGLVVEKDHPQKLAMALVQFLKEKKLSRWHDLRNDCRNLTLERFSVEVMVRKFLTVWNENGK